MLWLLVYLAAILWYVTSSMRKPANYPPGPHWYPFFGCNSIIHSRMRTHGSQWKTISEMAKEYQTDVLGLKMGPEKVVVVFGEKNIRQVSTGKEFDARPDTFSLRLRSFGKRKGITFVEGSLWREHRMFTFKHLRGEGYGKPRMDTHVHEALQELLRYIEDSGGKPINVKIVVSMAVVNILWKYVAGENIKKPTLIRFISLLSDRSKVSNVSGGWLNQWPWLRFVAPEWSGYATIRRLNDQLAEMIDESINKHLNKSVEGYDLMYSFLEEMRQQKQTYTLEQLRGICLDLLIAGAHTVGNTFDFVVISAIRHRDIQEKVYDEIKNILGNEVPCWRDSARLVYTNAFLCEVQRCYPIAPFSAPRRALADVSLGRYSIPAGATVLTSLGDLNIDPRLWDKPNTFDPEHFIDANGDLKTSTHLYPFGIGRRQCPGLPLAKVFLFITCVGVLQQYSIERRHPHAPPPTDEPITGILSEARPFTARFVKR